MSRATQRANRARKIREEKLRMLNHFTKYGDLPVKKMPEELLDKENYLGLDDPTPYLAVKNMIQRGEMVAAEM